MNDDENSEKVPIAETNVGGGKVERSSPPVDKARNRMIAEGYRYQTLHDDSDSDSDTVKKKKGLSRQNKILIAIIAVSIVIIAILTVVVAYMYLSQPRHVCDTPECVSISAYITSKMDLTAKPCENFYDFACGKWQKTTKFPESKAKYGSFQQISEKIFDKMKKIMAGDSLLVKGKNSTAVKKMRTIYSQCLDTKTIEGRGIAPINDFIEFLGSWTITSPSSKKWNESSWDLMDSLVASSYYGYTPLFAMGVSTDDLDSDSQVISFSQAGLGLNSYQQYLPNNTKHEEYRKAYIEFGTEVGALLGADRSYARQRMIDIYEFEKKLAFIFTPYTELQNPVTSYHKMKVQDLQKKLGNSINLQTFLGRNLGRTVSLDELILTSTPKYFEKLGPIIENTNKSLLADYIVWHAVNLLVGYFPKKFVDAAMILTKALSGVKKLDPLWRRCLSKAGAIGFATGALYVQENFKESSKGDVSNIIEQIRQAFIQNIPDVSWMDGPTKKRAIEKAKAIESKIGYPDWILDADKLDAYYENITVFPGKFLETRLSVLRFGRKMAFDKIGKPTNRKRWDMPPTEVNAYYTASLNQIVFPAAILQTPFYNPDFPVSFNYGSAGMIMGHELTHGFDNYGRHYDKFGNMKDWWTKVSAAGFNERTECVKKQYSKYVVEGLHILGAKTLGENIADNGGLKLAHKAYMNQVSAGKINRKEFPGLDFTPEQLFYIGFSQIWCSHYTPAYAKETIVTDPHTYAKYRVIGTLSNMPDFAKAFKCKTNSPMNPERKCTVW